MVLKVYKEIKKEELNILYEIPYMILNDSFSGIGKRIKDGYMHIHIWFDGLHLDGSYKYMGCEVIHETCTMEVI